MDMMRPVILALPPNKPSGLRSSVSGTGNRARLTLTWTDNSINETSFLVQKTTNGTTWTDVGTSDSPLNQPNVHGPRSLTDPAVYNPNVSVKYRVIARNTVGYGAQFPSLTVKSDPSDALAIGNPPSNFPNNLSAALGSAQVTLTWNDRASNEGWFVIERAVNSGAFTPIATAPARNGTGGVTFADTAIQPLTQYTYRVAAANLAGQSASSNTTTVTVPALPATPTITSATAALAGSGERVTLRWASAAGATGYTVQRSASAAFTTIAASTNVGNVTVFTTPTIARQTWYFRVIATNAVWQSAPSGVATVAAAGVAAAAAQPSRLAAAVPRLADVVVPRTVSRAALQGAGVTVRLTVPAGAQVLRVRVLAGTRTVWRDLRAVKASKHAQRVRLRVRSPRLRSLRSGRRYVLELTPGVRANKLGAATRVHIRVK
jgi:hypothetical protein